WRYVSDGWLAQKAVAGEVGSSTMPHKINPWFFENSEGNLGVANALFSHFSQKLPISRLQRDLSDSTVMRSFGTALGHCLVGYEYLLKALARVHVNRSTMLAALKKHPEVITEAIQTILRREGVPMPYEKLKNLTRGREVSLEELRAFIKTLSVRGAVKKELLKFAPENYIGLAGTLSARK
ncbi:MAG: adenylosuccinate lyase, partial [Patescibacteria group bacterium]